MLGEATIRFFDPEIRGERVQIVDVWSPPLWSSGRVMLCTDGYLEYYFTQVDLCRPWMHAVMDGLDGGLRGTHLAWLLPDRKDITDEPIVSAYLNSTGG